MNRLRSAYYRTTTSLWNLPLPLPGADRGDSVSIICFHGVHDSAMERIAPPPTSSVAAASFEENIRAVSRYHRVIPLAEAVAMLAGRAPWRPKCAVLTFDDSLKCTVDVAFRILERLGLTGTVFISTAAIEGARPYWWLRLDYAYHRGSAARAELAVAGEPSCRVIRGDVESLRRAKSILRRIPAEAREAAVDELSRQLGASLDAAASGFPYAQPMSWQDARDALRRGFDVGSHTVTHPNLAILPPDQMRSELAASKDKIERQLDARCAHFCYPYGAFTPDVAKQAAESGYDAAVSTIAPGRNSQGQDLFTLNRYSAPGIPGKLAFQLSGFPAAVASAKALLRPGAGMSAGR